MTTLVISTTEPPAPSISNSSNTLPVSGYLPNPQDQHWAWPNSTHFDSSDGDMLDPGRSHSMIYGSESFLHDNIGDGFLDFEVEEPLTPAGSSTAVAPAAAEIPSTQETHQNLPRQARKQRSDIDSACVLQSCRLISDLENYIAADVKAFQILLDIVRKAIRGLTELIGQQKESRNLRCIMLFSTLCYQIVELLEMCHDTVSGPTYQSSLIRTVGLGIPGFGDDDEEQTAWQAQRILKETHQGCEMVRKLRLLAGVGPENQSAGGTAESSNREHCFNDVERRFKELGVIVNRKI